MNNSRIRLASLFSMIILLAACQQTSPERPATTIKLQELSTKININTQDSQRAETLPEIRMLVGKLERTFQFYLPENSDPTAPMPVVFVYHDERSNSQTFFKYSGWRSVADQENVLLIFPNKLTPQGETERRPTSWQVTSEEGHDLAFFDKMLEFLDTKKNIDANRIYATGLSSGASLCYLLAIERPERLAAIGPVGGECLAEPLTTPSEETVSALHMRGIQDPLLLWQWQDPKPNANEILQSRLSTTIESYTQSFGFPSEFEEDTSMEGQYCFRYQHPNQSATYEYRLLDKVKHVYPGFTKVDLDRQGANSPNIKGAEEMWIFFVAHPKEQLSI